ncbi:uncharacterized protein LOC131674545 isoform X4 [Phymastichus coffea]|uniref:uncharacterized protein LOC131674545 isoform X4 n=1 Tax=Phymastichus coffea TaxID=108790 RepID=UPI00273B604F|nr:uncharacterized protein LOC131674545 isoform X4 [Phymastichus coffea]
MASVSTGYYLTGKIKVLWKRGWIKMPEIMVSTAGALIGICLSIGTYLYKDSHHGWNQKYVSRYMVIRPDDPRVPKIQRYSRLD